MNQGLVDTSKAAEALVGFFSIFLSIGNIDKI